MLKFEIEKSNWKHIANKLFNESVDAEGSRNTTSGSPPKKNRL